MQQIPTDTYQLALAHHLGKPLAVYPARVVGSNLVFGVIGAMLIGGLIFWGIHAHQWVVLLPILLLLLALYGLFESTRWLCDLLLVVCTEGLLRIWNDEAESVRWDEIDELWRDMRGNFTFSRADGTRFIVNHVFQNLEELGEIIEEEVTHHLLPQVLASYRRGKPVHFGSVEVNQKGISTVGAFLPWSKIVQVTVHGSMLTFKQRGTLLNGLFVSVRDTPNLCVLEALIETLLRGDPS